MGGEDVLGIVFEIEDRDDTLIADALDLGVRTVTLLVEREVELVVEDRVFKHFEPLGSLTLVIVEEHLSEIVGGLSVKGAQ